MAPRTLLLAAIVTTLTASIGYRCANDAKAESHTFTPLTPPITDQRTVPPLVELETQIPDGNDILALYKAAETVAAVQDANRTVEAEIVKASSVVSSLAAFHAALIASCEHQIDLASINAIAVKAKSLADTVARIEREVARSLGIMGKAVDRDGLASERAKDALDRYVIAAHRLGQLKVQALETDKTAQGLMASIKRTAEQNCHPQRITRLFTQGLASEAAVPSEGTEFSTLPMPPKRPLIRRTVDRSQQGYLSHAAKKARPLLLFTCDGRSCPSD